MLRPFSLHAALGQALLHKAQLSDASLSLAPGLPLHLVGRLVAGPAAGARSAAYLGDAYEDHFLLPQGHVLIITNRRIIMVNAPGGWPGQAACPPPYESWSLPCS